MNTSMLGLPKEGCAFGPCRQSRDRGGPGCDLCDRVAKILAKMTPCGKTVNGEPCTLVYQHPSWVACRSKAKASKDEAQSNPERDGERPDKDDTNLAFKKRHRVGPHR